MDGPQGGGDGTAPNRAAAASACESEGSRQSPEAGRDGGWEQRRVADLRRTTERHLSADFSVRKRGRFLPCGWQSNKPRSRGRQQL